MSKKVKGHPLVTKAINDHSEPFLHMCYTRYCGKNTVSGVLAWEELGNSLIDLLTCGDMDYERVSKLDTVKWYPIVSASTPLGVLDSLECTLSSIGYSSMDECTQRRYWDTVRHIGYYVKNNGWDLEYYDERLKDLNNILTKEDVEGHLESLGFKIKEGNK